MKKLVVISLAAAATSLVLARTNVAGTFMDWLAEQVQEPQD